MKIAICTPHYADVAAEYAVSLARMLLWTQRARIVFNGEPTEPQIEVFLRKGTILPRVRNALAKDAADWGANYLLWIDGDHSFPPDALLQLLRHNLPIIGANYARRTSPTCPTAASLDRKLIWTTREIAERGDVEEVLRLGLGFCLVDMNVIQKLRASGEPLFSIEMVDDGLSVISEDTHFFRRAREAGFAAYVDHGLSWNIGHVHSRVITAEQTLLDREAFEESQRKRT